LLDLVRKLTAQKIGIIYISHYLPEIFEIGDRVTVLKDGRVVDTQKVRSTDLRTITRKMLGQDRALFYKRDHVQTREIALRVRNLSRRGQFEKVSFDVYRGEILGFGGLVGAGRSALMNVLFAADRSDVGEIILNDRAITPKSPREAIAHGVAMIPEDRKLQGLFDLRSVLENIVIVDNETNVLFLNHRHESVGVSDLINRLHIVTQGAQQPVGYLSGGNQQKVILARWLLSKAQIFIFDEPTKGVDIGAKAQIYDLMVQLTQLGKSILMVSSDIPELVSMSDRIAVMRNGVLVTVFAAQDVTEQELLGSFLGISEHGRGNK
jgi:ribose transport system ATP-binding protein